MNLSEKNQAECEDFITECEGLANELETKNPFDCVGDASRVRFLVSKYKEHHALVEDNERLRDYMERLWTELLRMQSVCGEEDFPIIEDLLNEKEALKTEVKE